MRDDAGMTLRGQGDLLHAAGRGRADRPAGGVLRFAGCNLWTGREEDRADAVCTFCDTDFVGTDGTERRQLSPMRRRSPTAIAAQWPDRGSRRALSSAPAASRCCSSIAPLIEALHARGFEIAIETNGTIAPPPGIDWICVSPKAGATAGRDVGRRTEAGLSAGRGSTRSISPGLDFRRFSLQPMDGPDRASNTEAAIAYCLAHPQWRLSLQTHKMTGIR